MTPPLTPFPVSSLPTAIQSVPVEYKLKRRKVRDFDLENCELLEMVQFCCDPPRIRVEKPPTAPIYCEPVVRLFRRCAKGSKMFTVETTAWEGDLAKKDGRGLTPAEAFARTQREKAKLKPKAEGASGSNKS